MKKTNYIISLGSNTPDGDKTLAKAIQTLQIMYESVSYTRILRNKAVDMEESAPDFHNALVCLATMEDVDRVICTCKALEISMGDTKELRKEGKIVFDADLVMIDGEVRRQKDFDREYFQILLPEITKEQ